MMHCAHAQSNRTRSDTDRQPVRRNLVRGDNFFCILCARAAIKKVVTFATVNDSGAVEFSFYSKVRWITDRC